MSCDQGSHSFAYNRSAQRWQCVRCSKEAEPGWEPNCDYTFPEPREAQEGAQAMSGGQEWVPQFSIYIRRLRAGGYGIYLDRDTIRGGPSFEVADESELLERLRGVLVPAPTEAR